MEEEANLLLGRNPQGNFFCAADATHKLSEIFCDVFFFKTLSLSEAVVYPSKDSTPPDCVKVKGRLHLRASFLFLFHFLVAKVTTRLCHKFNVVVSGLRRLNSIFGCKRTPRTDKVFG